jgi:hypothetical protein
MDLLVHELEAQLRIKRSAQQIPFEHFDLEFTSQGSRPVYERPPDPGSMELRIDEYGANLVSEERYESDDVAVSFPDTGLCFR